MTADIVIGRMPSPSEFASAAPSAVAALAEEPAVSGCFVVAGAEVPGAPAPVPVLDAGPWEIAPAGEDRACAAAWIE